MVTGCYFVVLGSWLILVNFTCTLINTSSSLLYKYLLSYQFIQYDISIEVQSYSLSSRFFGLVNLGSLICRHISDKYRKPTS